ncbi:unnamed protein product [Victoria cruziana]
MSKAGERRRSSKKKGLAPKVFLSLLHFSSIFPLLLLFVFHVLRVLPFPPSLLQGFSEWTAYWNLGELPFHELSCLRVDSILASASSSIRSGRSLWTSSPSTVEDLHPWPLQEAKERRIRRYSLKTLWL